MTVCTVLLSEHELNQLDQKKLHDLIRTMSLHHIHEIICLQKCKSLSMRATTKGKTQCSFISPSFIISAALALTSICRAGTSTQNVPFSRSGEEGTRISSKMALPKETSWLKSKNRKIYKAKKREREREREEMKRRRRRKMNLESEMSFSAPDIFIGNEEHQRGFF
jgi:hypothetical protein